MSETQTNIIPQSIQTEVANAIEQAGQIKELTITKPGEFEAANEQFKFISELSRGLEKCRKELKQPYIERGKVVDNFFKPAQSALGSAKKIIDGAIRQYQAYLAEQRRKEQERLDRIAEEKRRKEEEKARKEREKAEKYREQGRQEMAEKAEQRALYKEIATEVIVPPVVQDVTPKLSGTTVRANWKFDISDEQELCRWAAANNRWELLAPNTTALNQWAKMIRKEQRVPGGRIFNDSRLTGTGR